MKKNLLSLFIVLISIFSTATILYAASASASLSGTGTVRAGDTITVTFNLNGKGIYGGSGTLSYDTSQLTLTGTTKKISSPWQVEFNGNKFVCYDNNLTAPINSGKAIFSATFKVKDSVAPGTKISVSVTGITASDGSADINVGSVSYAKSIAPPLSKNANLSALSVSNATLSPSFSKSKTSYSTTVPYSVKSLNINATKEDANAKVAISGNSLSVGRNTVTIKVTAENGATKTYTITAIREQDPNYVPSNNANLESIDIENGILSPQFNAEVLEYIVYLPFEITEFKASGKAASSKAQSVKEETKELIVGENEVKINVIAEDGTSKVYTITVVRMPEFGVEPEDPIEVEEESPEINDVEEEPNTDDLEEVLGDPQAAGVPIWMAVIMAFIGMPIGAGGLMLINKEKNGKNSLGA